MASTVNTEAITRTEFDAMVERMASRLAALESNESRPPTLIDQERRALSGQSEAVTQNEFRLFKWLATFVAAAVLGALGVLYQQIADTRVEIRDLHTTILQELHAQIGGLRRELRQAETRCLASGDDSSGARRLASRDRRLASGNEGKRRQHPRSDRIPARTRCPCRDPFGRGGTSHRELTCGSGVTASGLTRRPV